MIIYQYSVVTNVDHKTVDKQKYFWILSSKPYHAVNPYTEKLYTKESHLSNQAENININFIGLFGWHKLKFHHARFNATICTGST